MLYAHGPDLCHESDLKHAMANCFEALLGTDIHQLQEQIHVINVKQGILNTTFINYLSHDW